MGSDYGPYYTKGLCKVKLWECTYTLDCKRWTDKSIDYWSGTAKIHKSTIEQFWHRVNTDYAISDYACREIQREKGKEYKLRIVERIYK